MSDVLTIYTERLILKPHGADSRDGDDCSRAVLESIDDLRPFAPWVQQPEDHTPEKMSEVANELFQKYLAGTDLFMTVRKHDNGQAAELVTNVELYKIDKEQGICSTGYWTPTAMVGKGYTKEALSALLTHGFEKLNLKSIYATCQRVNPVSLHILRSLGFQDIEPENAPAEHRTDNPERDIQFVLKA